MLRRLAVCTLFALVALAADVSGNWKLVMRAPNGETIDGRLTLKAEGQMLTGTIAGPKGEAPIQDGRVEGDTITFKIVRNERANQYTGEVKGNTMKLVVKDGDREATITATRE
jgi:hypothetical protein